tara:strand:- start:761 stop:1015 length:255 start_codon:yes stop_codon:yes gene_type:complete
MGTDLLAAPFTMAAASLNLNDAWDMSWGEGIQFLIVLIILYYIKKRIDLHFARKTAKNTIYKVKIVEGHIDVDHGDVVTHPKKW